MCSFTYLQRRQLLQYGPGFLGTSLAASVLGPLALTPPGAADEIPDRINTVSKQNLVAQKQLTIVGAFYSLDTGKVTLLS